MKDLRLVFKKIVWLLPLTLGLMSNSNTIKPLPKINKEFQVVVHIVYDKDTTNSITESTIIQQLNLANEYFKPIQASFKICEFRYIYNFQFHDTLRDERFVELTTQYYAPNRINMYVVGGFLDPNTCGKASLGGVSRFKDDLLIVRKECVSAITIGHELGHYFNLEHTFEGEGFELANGSNCASAGDKICDTPADPYIHGEKTTDYVNSNCIFYNTKKDANGEYYDPDVTNVMSYYACNCSKFSNQQFEKMVNYYMNNRLKW
jgi:hypothetical protein